MSKKLLSIISLLLVLASIFAFPVCAMEEDPEPPIDPDDPFVNIAAMSAGCSISSSGLATCNGYVLTANTTYTVYLSVSLQRYKNGYWQHYAGPWNSSGVHIASVYKQYYVVRGYYYRVGVTATVYDANGNFIESPTVYSSSRYY